MRKLATVERILEINDIPEADKIQTCRIRGWQCVIEKNKYKVNDLVIYCQIDSVLPERPEFEFLRKDKFRIRTCKFRGQISQGIVFPLSILPDDLQWHIDELLATQQISSLRYATTPIEGYDLTEELDLKLYEAPVPAELAGNAKGGFPNFLIKTDEERVQLLPQVIEEHKGNSFIVTEKLDGSSGTFYWKNGMFGVCGRNYEYLETLTNSFWKFARQNYLEEKLGTIGRNLGLQGEIIGEGIQKNKYKLKGQTVRFFRVFDIDKYEFLPYEEMVKLIAELKLETVPILDWNYILPNSVDEILKYAEGKSMLNPQSEREGVVFVKHESRNQGRLSFKAISNKFLIKNEE